MTVTVFKTPAGGGKTSTFAKRVAFANTDLRIEIYVTTHDLALEWKTLIKQFNSKCNVRIIGGRSRPAPDGKPLCVRHQVASQISQAGQSVYTRVGADRKLTHLRR